MNETLCIVVRVRLFILVLKQAFSIKISKSTNFKGALVGAIWILVKRHAGKVETQAFGLVVTTYVLNDKFKIEPRNPKIQTLSEHNTKGWQYVECATILQFDS